MSTTPRMSVAVLKVSGLEEALFGLSLSHGVADAPFVAGSETFQKVYKIAKKLSQKDGGHNKFLESIMVWIDVVAPRYWWQEADTYRISSRQSSSTIHTISKRLLSQEDFTENLMGELLTHINYCIVTLQDAKTQEEKKKRLHTLKNALPEGFLQRRVWCMSLKTLRNIILQRANHKLVHWQIFINEVLFQLPEEIQVLLPGNELQNSTSAE